MGRRISGFFSNDSIFGQIMTRLGILIAANLMFVVFSIPVVTIGPALAALYFVMFRVLRSSSGEVNPFREFWRGFRSCFKQGLLYWLILAILAFLGWIDIRFCRYAGGVLEYFRYAIYILAAAALIVTVHFFPVLAAFSDTLPHLLRNAVFFAGKNIFRAVVLAAVWFFPILVTVLDRRMFPLYGFLWTVIGFSAVAMLGASMLLKDFSKYLPPVSDGPVEDDEYGRSAPPEGGPEKDEASTFEDMKKLGM